VRQLAAALQRGLMQIIANNWAIHKGASKLAHFHEKVGSFKSKDSNFFKTSPS